MSCDNGIRFFEDMQNGGLNDCRNAIPRMEVKEFSSQMAAAVLTYMRWTASAIRRVRNMVDDPFVAARIRGEAYRFIAAGDPAARRTASMLHVELDELTLFFADCANELRVQKEKFGGHKGRSLILDTNDFLHYQRFDNIPWKAIYGAHTRVVIPHVVVDEIDRKSYEEGSRIARRARGVYRIIETYLHSIEATGFADLPDGSALEILEDEPGHNRLANNDDEIVARSAFLQQAVYPSKVTVVTRDIGMRTRARVWGLAAEKLDDKYLIREDRLSAADIDAAAEELTQPRR